MTTIFKQLFIEPKMAVNCFAHICNAIDPFYNVEVMQQVDRSHRGQIDNLLSVVDYFGSELTIHKDELYCEMKHSYNGHVLVTSVTLSEEFSVVSIYTVEDSVRKIAIDLYDLLRLLETPHFKAHEKVQPYKKYDTPKVKKTPRSPEPEITEMPEIDNWLDDDEA